MTTSLILIDSSLWIEFFNKKSQHKGHINALNELLSINLVAICPPIKAEILSGCKNKAEYEKLKNLFSYLTNLSAPENVWEEIERSRFDLLRRGLNVSLIDLWIALTAYYHKVALWTLDEDFKIISSIIPINLFNINKQL